MIPESNYTNIISKVDPLFSYLAKQQENQKSAKLLEIGCTFILVSFFVFFAIKPTSLTISKLIGDIRAKEVLSKELRGKINDVIISQDLFSQVQEKYLIVESSLPDKPGFYHANSQILGLTQKNKIILDGISYSVTDLNNFSTSISTSSSFLSASSLISQILQNRRLIKINQFSLEVDKDASGNLIQMNLPLKIYYWSQNVEN